MNTNPAGISQMISFTAKAVLMALAATGVLAWDENTSTTVAIAVTALVDVALYFGFVKPRTNPTTDEPSDLDS